MLSDFLGLFARRVSGPGITGPEGTGPLSLSRGALSQVLEIPNLLKGRERTGQRQGRVVVEWVLVRGDRMVESQEEEDKGLPSFPTSVTASGILSQHLSLKTA